MTGIPDEAGRAGVAAYMALPDLVDSQDDVVMAILAAALPILRRQWETECREQMCAEVKDIANARHIYVQRNVNRFIDRCGGNVSDDEIAASYQRGEDDWNRNHPALIALWRRHDALREESKTQAGDPK